jgi:hypothetical protein
MSARSIGKYLFCYRYAFKEAVPDLAVVGPYHGRDGLDCRAAVKWAIGWLIGSILKMKLGG